MEPFKNFISPNLVLTLAFHLQNQMPDFEKEAYEKSILDSLETLELKERAQLIADKTHFVLPDDFKERSRILLAILHPDESAKESDKKGMSGWAMMPLTRVISQNGMKDFDNSLELLRQMTSRFSSEFDVRFFILENQSRALKIIQSWASDKNHHVRRLVSEGTRPRLPWAMALASLIADPSPMLPILKILRDDESEYVRKSVANHLNDIAKDHPDLIGELANDWIKDADKNRQKLLRHACRTLIKQGHENTLKAFGIEPPEIDLSKLKINTPKVMFGESLKFEINLISKSKKPQQIIIDYLVHFKKANGKLAPKIFKGSKFILAPNETRPFSRSHPIRKITTRKYYDGEHALSLRINGKDFTYEKFELLMPKD